MLSCESSNQEAVERAETTEQVEVEASTPLPSGISKATLEQMASITASDKPAKRPDIKAIDINSPNKDHPRATKVPEVQQIREQVVVLEPISLDLGTFSTSEKGVGTVTLTNTGDESVTVVSAKASCGCTTSDFKNNTVLAPGESTDVTVTMTGKGKSRKLSKTVTFNISNYPPLKLQVLAEAISFVTLDVDPLEIDEETGTSTITLTSRDGQPFNVISIIPAIAGDLPTEPAATQQLDIDWNTFWDVVTTTRITIRLDHPLCREITTSVHMTPGQRQQFNETIRQRREGGEILSKDPTKPVTGDQLSRYIKSGRGDQVLRFIKEGRGKFNAVGRDGASLLSTAAQAGDATTVSELLEMGAQLERVDRTNRTPLMYAARSKNPEVIRILIGAGADIKARDRIGNTPLSWASGFGTPDVVQALIDEGADANTVGVALGWTPLLWASGFGDSDSIPILIKAGADVNVYDTIEGRTPLMHAIRTGTTEGVATLLEAGSNVNAIDNIKMTALHIGAQNSNVTLDKIKLLVEAGVNVNAKDKDGETALDYANTRTDDNAGSVVNYLTEHSKGN
jgi:ankyrin repeat protein